MKKFGIIGYPLEHSFSPKYFADKFEKEGLKDCSYEAFPIKTIRDLNKIIKDEPDLVGFNVTSPYKKEILSQLYEIDKEAVNAWAVNTVKITRIKSRVLLKGYNTDTYGFLTSISPLLQEWHNKALILGTGGAATAAKYGLSKLGIECQQVSRKMSYEYLAYEDLNDSIMSEYKLIVNATPIGTYPNEKVSPNIPYQYLNKRHLCFDMVYNPEETLFMKQSLAQGATVKNGLEMLYLQAEKAWEIWN